MTELIISFLAGTLSGWFANYLWYKWQERRQDTHLKLEADNRGLKFSGRVNAEATKEDVSTKEMLNALNSSIQK